MGEEEYELGDGEVEGGPTQHSHVFPPESDSESEADMAELRRKVLASRVFTSPLTPTSSAASDFNQYAHADSEEEDTDEGGVNIADAYPVLQEQGPSITHGSAMKENEELVTVLSQTVIAAPR